MNRLKVISTDLKLDQWIKILNNRLKFRSTDQKLEKRLKVRFTRIPILILKNTFLVGWLAGEIGIKATSASDKLYFYVKV